jgi:DHA1 family multidrug resistance protein-like MFS transporter
MAKSRGYLLFISLMFGILFNLGNPAIPLYTNSLDIGGMFVGFYLASGGLGLMIFATMWGAIGDILDRNKVLAITFIGFAFGQTIVGLFTNEYSILLGMFISGIFGAGVLVNIYSYINDNFVKEQLRNKVLSYAVSLYMIGGAFAYLLGGLITRSLDPHYNYMFFIQAILLLIFGLYIYFEKTDLVDTDNHLTRVYFWNNMKQVVKLPWVPIYTITITFFISFSHNNVRRFLDYYIIDSNYSALDLGLLVFVVGIVSLVSNLVIAPYFLKRFHNFRFLQVQFLFAPILLYLGFRTDNILIGLYTFYIGYSIMLAIYEPTAISFMSDNKAVPQGILVGVRQSIVGLGMTLGFIIGGFLYEINELYVFYLSVIFYIMVFVGFTILIYIKKTEVVSYRLNYLKEVNSND